MSEPIDNPHDWIAALTQAVASLGHRQLLELATLLQPNLPASPSAAQLQRALSLSTTVATQLARDLGQVIHVSAVTAHDIRTVVITLSRMRASGSEPADAVEIACTAPTRFGVPLRTTYATALEMVGDARSEILVVGYVFTAGAKGLLEEIARASRDRRIRVTMIGNRMEDHLPALNSVWPAGCREPDIFSFPPNPRDEMAALHAKVLICDSSTALVTSANFSHHGFHENIEIGVKVTSPSVARLADFFRSLIAAGDAIPLPWK